MFDLRQFARDNNIVVVHEGHKHARRGWGQMACPFCTGNTGYHLGWNYAYGYFNCWRCKQHSKMETIRAFLKCSWQQARAIDKQYDVLATHLPEVKAVELATKCKMPRGCGELREAHRSYLRRRNFDPDKLEDTWGLEGTGPTGDYRLRVIAPIYHYGQLVSYQGRDITGKQTPPYKACPRKNEARQHQHCLYGLDKVPGREIVVVEGIVDAWRLGPGAVSTFGISWTTAQLKLLADYDVAYIVFDPVDPQAIEQAENLAVNLAVMGADAYVIEIDAADPGELSNKQARKLMENLLG